MTVKEATRKMSGYFKRRVANSADAGVKYLLSRDKKPRQICRGSGN